MLAFMLAAGCRIRNAESSPLTAGRLQDYARYLKDAAVRDIPEKFISLMAIDEYEALPDDEKQKPIYNSYRYDRIDGDGFRYYSKFGYVLVDHKRLMENTSVWAYRPYVFTCSGSESEGYDWTVAMVKGYAYIIYDQGANRLWMEDDTVFFEFSAREKSTDGYTAVIKSKTPMKYSIEDRTYSLSCRVEIFNPDGSLAEWIEIEETDLHEHFTTSRD